MSLHLSSRKRSRLAVHMRADQGDGLRDLRGNAMTFTRSGTRKTTLGSGRVIDCVANQGRIEWVDRDGDGVREQPTIAVGQSHVNVCLQSENLSVVANWILGGTPLLTGGFADPFGGANGWLLVDNDAVANEYLIQRITFTGNATKTAAMYIKRGTGVQAVAMFDNSAGVYRRSIAINWDNAGKPVLSNALGTGSFGVEPSETLIGQLLGWWRIWFQVPGVIAANANDLYIFGASGAGTDQGSVYVTGVCAWNSDVPWDYVKTTTAVAGVNAESLSIATNIVPQPAAMYAKYIHGSSHANSFGIVGLLESGVDRFDVYFDQAVGGYVVFLSNGVVSTYAALGIMGNMNIGDTIEVLGRIVRSASSLAYSTDANLWGVDLTVTINGVEYYQGAMSAAPIALSTNPWTSVAVGGSAGTNIGNNKFINAKVALGGIPTLPQMRSAF